MKNFKNFFNTIVPGLMVAISLDGYRRTVNNDLINKNTDKIIQETVRKSLDLSNKLNEQIEQQMIENVEIQAELGRVKESIEDIMNNAKIINSFTNEVNIKANETLIIESSKVIEKSAIKTNDLIDKILDFINNSSSGNNNNFINITNIIDNINNFLSSFNSIQLSAIGHIFTCITILICI